MTSSVVSSVCSTLRIIRNKQRKICISGRKVVFLRQNLVKIKIHYNEYFVQMA